MSDYNDAYNSYLAQDLEAARRQRDLELYKNAMNQNLQNQSILNYWTVSTVLPIQACPQKFVHPEELEPPNYIEPLSDEDREVEIRESAKGFSDSDDPDVFLLRLLDEARAEIERLKTLIPAQPESVPLLSGPFWKQPEE